MARLAVLAWVLLAWPLPALVAGAAGWHGVWGSGSALVDYLIPVPVAGGVLHVPSFLLGAVAVAQAPRWSALALSRARVLALCVALAGGFFLFDLPGGRVHENPLALFLLSDGLLALAALSLLGGQLGFRREPLSVGVALVLGPLLGLAALMALLGPGAPDFNPGLASSDSTGTYKRQFVHTTKGPDGERFRARAGLGRAAPAPVAGKGRGGGVGVLHRPERGRPDGPRRRRVHHAVPVRGRHATALAGRRGHLLA